MSHISDLIELARRLAEERQTTASNATRPQMTLAQQEYAEALAKRYEIENEGAE